MKPVPFPVADAVAQVPRRVFLGRVVGAAALGSLLGREAAGGGQTHFPPTARRVIYLFQSGAPSQLDLFDHKPRLKDLFGKDLPESVRRGQRLLAPADVDDRQPGVTQPAGVERHRTEVVGTAVRDPLQHAFEFLRIERSVLRHYSAHVFVFTPSSVA